MSCLNFESIRKILVPTDGSLHSNHAAEYAIELAKKMSAEIIVLYVMDTVALEQTSRLTEREGMERELKENGQRYINYALGLAKAAGVRASSLLAKGRPFEQIVHLAKGLGTDLIVMGTFGLRSAERILIGSVAERVIEYSPCPVLVVK